MTVDPRAMSALRCQHRTSSILTPPIQCEADAVWLVFAARSASPTHSLAVIDPQPIVPVCSEHLHAVMFDDFGVPIPDREWFVRPVRWGAS